MSRLFHALVVAGAAISASATACGGKSTESNSDGDDGSTGGKSGAGGTDPTGGAAPTGGVGSVAPTGGAAGSSGVGGLPEPGRGAQWNCQPTSPECVEVLGTTASLIPDECPVDPTRPRTAADCAPGELFTCVLAVTPSSELLLVNCYCEEASSYSCDACSNLSFYHGAPAYCDGLRKVCACAYTGILR